MSTVRERVEAILALRDNASKDGFDIKKIKLNDSQNIGHILDVESNLHYSLNSREVSFFISAANNIEPICQALLVALNTLEKLSHIPSEEHRYGLSAELAHSVQSLSLSNIALEKINQIILGEK